MTRNRTFFLAGLFVALLLAGGVSYWASASPDGLNKVAVDLGFDSTQEQHAADDSPLAGYTTKGVDNPVLSNLISGVAGVALTLGIGAGLFLVLRRGKPDPDDEQQHEEPDEHPAPSATTGITSPGRR